MRARVEEVLRRLLGVKELVVGGAHFEPHGVEIEVRPRQRRARCPECGRPSPGYEFEQMTAWLAQRMDRPATCRLMGINWRKLSRTLRRFKQGILAYTSTGLSNGLLEGLNNKSRLITRRAFGFHSAQALTAMIYLCCGGLSLTPPLVAPN